MMNELPLFAQADALTEAGKARRLGPAFARFIGSLDASSPAPLMLACLLLSELEGRGHSCLLLEDLANPAAMLGWSEDEWTSLRDAAGPLPDSPQDWSQLLHECRQVRGAGVPDDGQPLVLAANRFYLRRYWRDENVVADAVRQRAAPVALAAAVTSAARGGADAPDPVKIRAWLDVLFDHATRDGGPDWQRIACSVALRGKLAVITGGPGTGKTYTVARLLALLFAMEGANAGNLRVALAAPTGKAAARLKQSIDHALDQLSENVGDELPLRDLAARMGGARTLHSLLGARPDTRSFQHHAGNKLDVDVLIVDEASMVHLEMMAALLDALPDQARLILLGDKDQLASVEAGAVLGDLCHDAQRGGYSPSTLTYVEAATGQRIPPDFHGDAGALAQQTVMLRQSRRFSGPIGALAIAVNTGDVEEARAVLRSDDSGQLLWTDGAQQEDVLALAVDGREHAEGGYRDYLKLVKAGPHAGQPYEDWVRAVLRAFESFRLLCAVREGEWGVSGLNDAIAQRLERAKLIRRKSEWYVGRPVMVTRNDYATGVYNGDIGLTLPDPERAGSLRVWFSDGENVRSVLATRLRNVETAFAMTVHKSQGSEFRHTALVLPREASSVMARELIYTGITRAREFFTLVTPNGGVLPDAIAQRTHRASGLRALIAR
jgi:exodeoxyribonuclease V alpha subunit